MRRNALRLAVGSCAVTLAALASPPASAGYIGTVVASGLNNPRDLAFAPDGALYVAEAGVPTGSGPSTIVRGATNIHVETGSVTRYHEGAQTRVATGLPAIYNPATGETQGPNGIAFDAAGTGYVAVGLGANPNVRATDLAPGGENLAQLVRLGGTPTNFADLGTFEATRNPDGGLLDSNPWHVAAYAGGLLITDAGGNSLVAAAPNGTVSLIASFPDRALGGPGPTQAVPTAVAVGPDGAYYVGQLTGFPFVPGAAQIYRVTPDGATSVFQSGFTNVTDMAFGRDGSLYVLEFDANSILNPGADGALIRVAPDGTRTTLFSQGLVAATGLAIGPDGAFYVSNFGVAAGAGQVLRIADVPEPGSVALLVAGLAGCAWPVATRRLRRRR